MKLWGNGGTQGSEMKAQIQPVWPLLAFTERNTLAKHMFGGSGWAQNYLKFLYVII